jgi:hypothetical protein
MAGAGIGYRVSGIGYQVSGIRYQVSGIRYQVSGIRYQVSGIRYQVLGIRQRQSPAFGHGEGSTDIALNMQSATRFKFSVFGGVDGSFCIPSLLPNAIGDISVKKAKNKHNIIRLYTLLLFCICPCIDPNILDMALFALGVESRPPLPTA